jgi:hypothetical protein
MQVMESLARTIVAEVTGRHGEYSSNVSIMQQGHWNRSKRCSEPITHPDWVDVTTLSDEVVNAILYGKQGEEQSALVVRQKPVVVYGMTTVIN